MDDANPPMDAGVLRSYTLGDPDDERELLVQFLESTRDDMEGVRVALAGGDAEAVARAAHRVKGSSRMIGALAQGDAAERLEQAARDGDAAALAPAAAALSAAHARLVKWLVAKTGDAA